MAPPKKRQKTSHDGKSCEASKDVVSAPARREPSAYIAIFENGPGSDPAYCRLNKKRMMFDVEDPEGPFRVAFSRLNPDATAFPVRLTFTEDATGKYTFRLPRGCDLVDVCVNFRVVFPDACGVRLKNGDLVQFYSKEDYFPPDTFSGPIEFQFFVSEKKQPKRRITAKKAAWELMPPEMLEKIFNLVPSCDLLRGVAGTCQTFRNIVFSGSLKPSVLELQSGLTRDESTGIDLIYGPDGLSQVENVIIHDFRFGAFFYSRNGSQDVRNRLLCRLEHLKTLEIRCYEYCACNGMAGVRPDLLHPNAQPKVLKVLVRNCCDRCDDMQRSISLSSLLSASVECYWIAATSKSNPPCYLGELMDRVEYKSCTFVYSSCNGRSKWTFGPSLVGQHVGRLVNFEGVYYLGLRLSLKNLARLNLTIPGKQLRAVFQDFVYPMTLKDLTLKINDDGSFNVDELKPTRTAVNLETLDLCLPEISEEFCQELCLHNPLLTRVSIQLTSVDISQSAMQLLQNKEGLQYLSVIGPIVSRP